jgi:hypothetical protein
VAEEVVLRSYIEVHARAGVVEDAHRTEVSSRLAAEGSVGAVTDDPLYLFVGPTAYGLESATFATRSDDGAPAARTCAPGSARVG